MASASGDKGEGYVEEFNFLQSLPAIVPEIGLALTAILVMALDNGFPGLFKGLPESQHKIIAWVTAIRAP